MNKFIGLNKIKKFKETKEFDIPIIEVTYVNGTVEYLSKLMFNEIVSDKECDLSELRDKRVVPVVASVLEVIRNWGLKVNELPHMSALLNGSLDENRKQAQCILWSEFMPQPVTPDDVDFITIDRVLKHKRTLKDVIGK